MGLVKVPKTMLNFFPLQYMTFWCLKCATKERRMESERVSGWMDRWIDVYWVEREMMDCAMDDCRERMMT